MQPITMELGSYQIFRFFSFFFRGLKAPSAKHVLHVVHVHFPSWVGRFLLLSFLYIRLPEFLPLLCLLARKTLPSRLLLAGLGLGYSPETRHETDTASSGIRVVGLPRVYQGTNAARLAFRRL